MFKITIRLVKLAGSLIIWLFDLLNALIGKSFGKKKAGTCVVLYYHVVSKQQRRMFAEQLDWLVKHSRPISLDNIPLLEAGVNHTAITFDDGFISVIMNALPELEARHIPVTIFVPTGWIGQTPLWPGVVEELKAHETVLDIHQLQAVNQYPWLNFGSHCISHPYLPELREHQAKEEIFQSKLQLEKALDVKIRTMSLPFGAFSNAHVEWAREAGYSQIFSSTPEMLTQIDSRKFLVGRVSVEPNDWPLEFRLKALGAYRWLPWAFFLKRKLRSLFTHCIDANKKK